MLKKPLCLITDHFVNKGVITSFARGLKCSVEDVNNFTDYSQPIATYGILRGTGEVLMKSKKFFYIDHGYFNSSAREFFGKTYFILQVFFLIPTLSSPFVSQLIFVTKKEKYRQQNERGEREYAVNYIIYKFTYIHVTLFR